MIRDDVVSILFRNTIHHIFPYNQKYIVVTTPPPPVLLKVVVEPSLASLGGGGVPKILPKRVGWCRNGGSHFFYYFTVQLYLLSLYLSLSLSLSVSLSLSASLSASLSLSLSFSLSLCLCRGGIKFALLHFDSSLFWVNHARFSSKSL